MKRILLLITITIMAFALKAQPCQSLFFSEYVEGSMQSKALEIYNPTENTISLDGYKIQRFSNGSSAMTSELPIQLKEGPNEIEPYGTIVISNGQITPNPDFGNAHVDTALYELADQNCSGIYPTPMYFNGNDAMVLVDPNGLPLDIFGKIGEDPGEGWCPQDSIDYQAPADYYWLSWTSNNRLVRKFDIEEGQTNPVIDYFNPAVEWDSIGWDTTNIDNNWSHLHYHECDCNPDNGIESTNTTETPVKVFPNPVQKGNSFTLFADKHINRVQIHDITGKVLYDEPIHKQTGIYSVNTNNFQKGIYLVRVLFTDHTNKSTRVILQ